MLMNKCSNMEIINPATEKSTKSMKEMRVLVSQDNLPLRMCTLAMSILSNNKDDLIKYVLKTVFSVYLITKDKEDEYKVVFKDNTVRQVQMIVNNDPKKSCDYQINVLPPKTKLHQFYNYSSLLNVKFASDVTLCVDGREILAHKLILATRSPVFWGMFMHEECEPGWQKLEIKDVDYDTMYDLLYFLYAGQFKDGAWLFTNEVFNKCKKLLKADSIYCVARLKEECEQRLITELSTKNLVDCLILADKYNALNLRKMAIQCFVSNSKEFAELLSGKLKKLHSQLLADIVKALIA